MTVSFDAALVAIIGVNIIYMAVIAFILFDIIPEKINAATAETRRTIYRVCRGGAIFDETQIRFDELPKGRRR